MLIESELPLDLFLRPAGDLPTFIQSEVADLLAPIFGDQQKTYGRIRTAAAGGFVHRRFPPNAKKTSPARFGPDDVGALAVLFAIWDLGVADKEIADATTRACYAWDRTVNPQPAYIPHGVPPVIAAMVGANRGQFWAFRLSTFHDDQSGARHIVSAVYDTDAPTADPSTLLPPSYLPRSAVTVCLPPLLLPLNRMFGRGKALN